MSHNQQTHNSDEGVFPLRPAKNAHLRVATLFLETVRTAAIVANSRVEIPAIPGSTERRSQRYQVGNAANARDIFQAILRSDIQNNGLLCQEIQKLYKEVLNPHTDEAQEGF